MPHEIQINLGASYSLSAFQYLPRQDGCANGWIKQYEFYVSTDGVNWGTAAATVTLSGAASANTTADANGNYNVGGLANGVYAVTPSKIGIVFSPVSQAVTVNGANESAVNFTAAPQITVSISPASASLVISGTQLGVQRTVTSSGIF